MPPRGREESSHGQYDIDADAFGPTDRTERVTGSTPVTTSPRWRVARSATAPPLSAAPPRGARPPECLSAVMSALRSRRAHEDHGEDYEAK